MSFDIGYSVKCDHVDRFGTSYLANTFACPKCEGTDYYYDMSWNSATGNLYQVINLELLEELSMKSVLTIKGNCPLHTEYGTSITKSVAAPSTSMESVIRLVESEVTAALAGLRGTQDMQLSIGQEVTEDEHIYSIQDIKVYAVDARTIQVEIGIITEAGKSMTFTV